MRTELIERAFQALSAGPEKAKKGHQKIAALYSAQNPFTGWENYKKKLIHVTDKSPELGWALCHYDSGKIIPIDGDAKKRRKVVKDIRYALYRWRTQERVDALIQGQKDRGETPRDRNPLSDEQVEIVKRYEGNLAVIHNGGAFGFAIQWDVDPVDPSKVYVRGSSVEKQWDEDAEASAKELPMSSAKDKAKAK